MRPVVDCGAAPASSVRPPDARASRAAATRRTRPSADTRGLCARAGVDPRDRWPRRPADRDGDRRRGGHGRRPGGGRAARRGPRGCRHREGDARELRAAVRARLHRGTPEPTPHDEGGVPGARAGRGARRGRGQRRARDEDQLPRRGHDRARSCARRGRRDGAGGGGQEAAHGHVQRGRRGRTRAGRAFELRGGRRVQRPSRAPSGRPHAPGRRAGLRPHGGRRTG